MKTERKQPAWPASRPPRADLASAWSARLRVLREGPMVAGRSPRFQPGFNLSVGCHLRPKVFEFAVTHDTHKPKVGDPSTATEASGVKRATANSRRMSDRLFVRVVG